MSIDLDYLLKQKAHLESQIASSSDGTNSDNWEYANASRQFLRAYSEELERVELAIEGIKSRLPTHQPDGKEVG